MSSIIFEGNTYTFGATVSANPGTGTTSYVFGGLSSGWTYGFIIWAFNGVGPSSIVGPAIRQTLSVAPLELRDPFGAIAWVYPPYPVHTLQYWRGSEINLFGGSEEISPPYWNTSSVTRVNSGVTLPNGYTHGMILRLGDTIITQGIVPIIGITYYFSWYENRTFNAQQVALNAYQGAGDSSNFVGRQILPQINPTPMGNGQIPLGPTAGQTGWVRYAYEFTIQNVNANSSGSMYLGWRTYGGFAGQSYYIGAPQLEIVF